MLNQGLILISPIVLVRLLPVEDFGRYREFLLYASVLLSFATLGINSSLLRFVPERPALKWYFVRQTVLLTLGASVLTVVIALSLNVLWNGELLGEFVVPIVLYVLLFANLDFWEFLWLAEKRSLAVLSYTAGRLVARMLTVIAIASITHDVGVIVWGLVCLEVVRITVSLFAWHRCAEPVHGDTAGVWRDQLKFCMPFGSSMLVASLNRTVGKLVVAKMFGPVALAHYAIGTYVQPVIVVIRNSVSDVLLPEMVARDRTEQSDRLALFRRTTIVTAVFLFAAGIVLARFAHEFVTVLFSEEYQPAVLIFQLYLISFLRDALDFGVPLRAINNTTPILRSNVLALIINTVLLAALVPWLGLQGAVIAFVASSMVEGAYLGLQVKRAYGASMRELVAWRDLAKVTIACAISAVVLYGDFWTQRLGLGGVVLGGAVYFIVFVALLMLLRLPEAMKFHAYLRSLVSKPEAIPRSTRRTSG